MPSFRTTRRVDFSADQMFDLVADVEKYPLFLPLCEALTVESRDVDASGDGVLVARMVAGYGTIHETFKTRVTLKRASRLIDVDYIDGPFRYLRNSWSFREADGGCEVVFFIDYEFKSAMLGLLVGAMFDRAFRKFSEAFEDRARVVYGTRPAGAAISG